MNRCKMAPIWHDQLITVGIPILSNISQYSKVVNTPSNAREKDLHSETKRSFNAFDRVW